MSYQLQCGWLYFRRKLFRILTGTSFQCLQTGAKFQRTIHAKLASKSKISTLRSRPLRIALCAQAQAGSPMQSSQMLVSHQIYFHCLVNVFKYWFNKNARCTCRVHYPQNTYFLRFFFVDLRMWLGSTRSSRTPVGNSIDCVIILNWSLSPVVFLSYKCAGVTRDDHNWGDISCGMMCKVIVPPHPLLKHHLAIARNKDTPSGTFRAAVSEIGKILIYELSRDWLQTVDFQVC